MLSTIHLLLTYKCTLRCEHCYVYGSPKGEGNLNYTLVNRLLDQALKIRTVEWVIFEGGEPFLFYPLLLKSVQKARKLGFKVGVYTNGFFARTEEAAVRYLHPLVNLRLDKLQISIDRFHYKKQDDTPAQRAGRAAISLGLPVYWENIMIPGDQETSPDQDVSDRSSNSTRLMMAGRAAEKLASQMPKADPFTLNSCPNEGLTNPHRLFIDASGHVQICPGLAIGNAWKNPLSEILDHYKPANHPICGPLNSGGPDLLRKSYSFMTDGELIDGCHVCYLTRRYLIERFPEYLAPRQVYGI